MRPSARTVRIRIITHSTGSAPASPPQTAFGILAERDGGYRLTAFSLKQGRWRVARARGLRR